MLNQLDSFLVVTTLTFYLLGSTWTMKDVKNTVIKTLLLTAGVWGVALLMGWS